jgi:hypothetical protein
MFSLVASAQIPTAPPQPTSGPSGSTYSYGSTKLYGPYHANSSGLPAYNYAIYQPTVAAKTSSLPVVLFLHGHLAGLEGSTSLGDSPSNYIVWIYQLCNNGFTVVFPVYDGDTGYNQFPEVILTDWTSALQTLAARKDGLIPPSADSIGMQTACTGHSFGAYECLAVSQLISTTKPAGVPLLRALALMTLGISGDPLSVDFSNLDPGTSVVMATGDQDTTNNDIGVGIQIYQSLEKAIPVSQRDYLDVISDSHGTPNQIGNHFFPMTNGMFDDAAVDDRDYNVSWKLSVGLFDCVFRKTYCSYGLGHGSAQQIDMGVWSDGVPVTPLRWLQSPK